VKHAVRQRIERGIIIAATETPHKVKDFYVIHGWHSDAESCACPDHEYTGATCKHMVCATIWEAREHVRSVA
jgi:hypothetical protein